jgi:hypothetical protein
MSSDLKSAELKMSVEADATSNGAAAGSRRPAYLTFALQTLAPLLIAGAMLTWPAVWNRFPLMFFDTSGYVTRSAALARPLALQTAPTARISAVHGPGGEQESFTWKISNNPLFLRPIFYSVWLAPFSTGLTFWLLPFGQGVLAAYLLSRLLRSFGVQSATALLACVGALALASSLPWHVSYVMPDVFTGFVILLSFLIVSGWSERSWPGRVWDVGLLGFFVAIHLSHIPLMAGLIGVYAVGGWLTKRPLAVAIRAGGGVLALCAALALSLAVLVGSNYAAARKLTISESSGLFLLARLIGDGPARDYLTTACPKRHYLLCDDQKALTAASRPGSVSDSFLWSSGGAVKQLASPRFLSEAAEINRQTIGAYPLAVMSNVVRNGARQLFTLQLDDSLNIEPTSWMRASVASIDERFASAAGRSKQASGDFPLQVLRLVLNGGLVAALVAIAALGLRFRNRIPALAWRFAAVIALALLGNAMVTGGLSDVHDRYQNRVAWLIVLLPVVMALSAHAGRTAAKPPQAT